MLWQIQAEKYGADIERVQVWDAFSEFFLDTWLDEGQLERIAQVAAQSPFSLYELDHIFCREVFPVCVWNFFELPGGEWAGFDPDWLIPRCMEHQKSNPFKPKSKPWRSAYVSPISRLLHLEPVFRRVAELRGIVYEDWGLHEGVLHFELILKQLQIAFNKLVKLVTTYWFCLRTMWVFSFGLFIAFYIAAFGHWDTWQIPLWGETVYDERILALQWCAVGLRACHLVVEYPSLFVWTPGMIGFALAKLSFSPEERVRNLARDAHRLLAATAIMALLLTVFSLWTEASNHCPHHALFSNCNLVFHMVVGALFMALLFAVLLNLPDEDGY